MATTVDGTHEHPEPTPARAPVNLLVVLWQRKWLVGLGLAVGLVVGGIVAARSQPIYRSSAEVLVIKKRSNVVPIAGGDPSQPYLEDYMSTHVALLKSPAILEKAVKKGDLAELPTFAGQTNPAAVIASGLTVTRDSGSSTYRTTIELSYQGPVAADTGTILQAVIDSYREFVGGAYRNVSQETEDLIKKAQDVLKKDLEVKEKEYQAFREKAPLLSKNKEGLNVHQMRIMEIDAKRSDLVIRKAELEGRLRAAEEARKSGKGQLDLLLPHTEPGSKREAAGEHFGAEELLASLLHQEQELLVNYAEDHPKVRAIHDKIALERKLLARRGVPAGSLPDDKDGDGLSNYVASVKRELAQSEVSEESLKALLDTELKEAKHLDSYEVKDQRYRGDLSRSQQLYELTIRRLQEINLVRDFGGYDAEVISPPAPGLMVAPSLIRILMLAVGLGLVGGAGLAYVADMTDKSFRTAEEIRRRLGMTIMGHIPFDTGTREQLSANGDEEASWRPAHSLCVYHRPNSMDAEAYRALRTALYFATQGEGRKVIQITSPSKGDGKTTLVANLGITIAQSGKRVILVDADLRRPRLARVFGLKSLQGLTSVLAGEADPTVLTQETGVPGLFVLPCGPRPANPAELLTSPCFGKVLAELKDNYDYVLIDTSPLLAVTDPCVVAGQVEGILLAIRVSKNGRPAAECAKEMLRGLGARVLGVAVNRIGPEAARNGYGYGHYSYYHYDDNYQAEDEAQAQAGGAAKSR